MGFTEIEETETKVLTNGFILLIKQMNEQAYENEAALAVEESGAKIANLQGYLAGVRKYKSMLQDAGSVADAVET